MENKMFCYQCQETIGNKGCTLAGACGKKPEVAALQDLLIYTTKGLSAIADQTRKEGREVPVFLDRLITDNLFSTITNANFDPEALERQIEKTLEAEDSLIMELESVSVLPEASFWRGSRDEYAEKARQVGVLATRDENIRSLRELITYGLKGMAAYLSHARVLGFEEAEIDAFLQSALAATLDDSLTENDLVALTLKTGEYGVRGMALLDQANTQTYGDPQITSVSIEAGERPAILISGHDLHDLEMLLEQTEGAGIDVYTHGEMLPAHAYPAFQKYDHLKGNYGNAWWKQTDEFERFNGPVLLTTNCLVPPKDTYKERIFTTGEVGFPGCAHIDADENGWKDFSSLIELARRCPAPDPIETGSVTGGFAHHQVEQLAARIVEEVQNGSIEKFVVMAGCDGRHKSREYYTEFAKELPDRDVILTAGCAKYRYNKLPLGDIHGIPRVLDAGQCNDSYSLVLSALLLKEAFGLDDINDLPIVYNIAWYEQKAVIVLLALLSLGVKNIHLGPTLPAFLSEDVARLLTETFGLSKIDTVESDRKAWME